MSKWDPIRKAIPRATIEEDGFFSRDLPDCDAEDRQAYYEDVRDQLSPLGWYLDDLYMDNDTIQGMLRRIEGAPLTKEEIYDAEIAPKLLEIAKLCEQHKLGFVAAVEYAPFELGRTVTYPTESSVAIRTVDWAVQSHGNADSLIWAMCRWARKKGHGSANLTILGVPPKPVEEPS